MSIYYHPLRKSILFVKKIPKPVRFCPTWNSTANVTTKKKSPSFAKNDLGQETDIKKNNRT